MLLALTLRTSVGPTGLPLPQHPFKRSHPFRGNVDMSLALDRVDVFDPARQLSTQPCDADACSRRALS